MLWVHLTVIGTFGVAMPFTLFGYGEQRVSSLLAGIWNATTPLVVLPLAVLLFRTERMTLRKAIGMVLGFLGVLVVLGVWEGVGGSHFTGQLMCFAAAACYGFVIPYAKKFVTDRPESGLSLAAGQLVTATVVLAIVAPLVAGAPTPLGDLSAKAIASVLTLGALGTGLAFVLNMRNIRLAGASTASMVTYLIPVFAVLLGVRGARRAPHLAPAGRRADRAARRRDLPGRPVPPGGHRAPRASRPGRRQAQPTAYAGR